MCQREGDNPPGRPCEDVACRHQSPEKDANEISDIRCPCFGCVCSSLAENHLRAQLRGSTEFSVS